MRSDWPVAREGMTVGLFGGSFDPPHAGHVHVSREALKRLGLDRVWWLVSPGQPAEGSWARPPGTPGRGGARQGHPSPRHRHGYRGAPRHAVYRRNDRGADRALSRRSVRLADGGGQPCAVSSLAALGLDHAHRADLRSGATRAPRSRRARRRRLRSFDRHARRPAWSALSSAAWPRRRHGSF
jgi:hypothetical protein